MLESTVVMSVQDNAETFRYIARQSGIDPNGSSLNVGVSTTDTISSQHFRTFSTRQIAF